MQKMAHMGLKGISSSAKGVNVSCETSAL